MGGGDERTEKCIAPVCSARNWRLARWIVDEAGAGENSACEWKIKRNNYPWIRMGELLLRIMVMVGLYRWYKTAKVLVSPWEL